MLKASSSSSNSDKRKTPANLTTDKWQMEFVPYLHGVYREDFRCHSADDVTFTHNFTQPPHFSCSSTIPTLTPEERSSRTRPQLTIWCEGDTAFDRMDSVSLDHPLQTFGDPESRSCLSRYIRQKCYDQYPVPNIVHWVYYKQDGDVKFDLRKALSFYR